MSILHQGRSIQICERIDDYELLPLDTVQAASLRSGLEAWLKSNEQEFHVPVIVGNVAACIDNEDNARLIMAREAI